MNKYHDCESCAFSKVEEAICDYCIDADQWEPEDVSDFGIITSNPKSVRIAKYYGKKLKEAV